MYEVNAEDIHENPDNVNDDFEIVCKRAALSVATTIYPMRNPDGQSETKPVFMLQITGNNQEKKMCVDLNSMVVNIILD